jgi:hypothetical protein
MRTYKVYYQFFRTLRSMDISAYSSAEAKQTLSKEYGIKPEYILKAVDYKDIHKKEQDKFGGLQR